MTKAKWHKDCGGKVYYKEGPKNANFEQAGECQKCGAFALFQEEIIFHINGMLYERFYEKSEFPNWRIVTKSRMKEILE